ncbi:MAG TPA: hypothetical protein VGM51_09625 [Armatimonadota bacterium]|jgi:hypothetical protein
MANLKSNARRALDLTTLALRIQTAVVAHKYVDKSTVEQVLNEYADCNIGFVTRTMNLVSVLSGLAKNPFGIFAFLSGAYKDPYADERASLQDFCKKWLNASGLTLTAYETDLVN